MTLDEFAAAVRNEIAGLGVADQVQLDAVCREGDQPFEATLSITSRPGATVRIALAQSVPADAAGRELRGELRRALRMCPLCQRIGHVEKLRDEAGHHNACLVRCPACGQFEIDQALIRDFRDAWERRDDRVLARLPELSRAVQEGRTGKITQENWKG